MVDTTSNDLALKAHLMRRAGFGATRDELERLSTQSYEDVVEDLLHPERFPALEEDVIIRYYGTDYEDPNLGGAIWIYRMVNTQRPLEEKIALFWHHVFATANHKVEHPSSLTGQITMFRRMGLSRLREILVALSKDPAMIFWLDNNENHRGEPNENYGRELLELFSMGVGKYTETDIKMAARAFTGWTFTQPIPVYPSGRYPSHFIYRAEDHDDGFKTFLGESGHLNGDDIVEVISRQPATARFISRHLYNFFVADEPQVPAWDETPPRDPDAVDELAKAYFDSDGEVRSVLRVLFNSDFFKEAQFQRVKSPAELVAGILKLVGTYTFPNEGIAAYANACTAMGQTLLGPPTVEGWHTGREWIDGGTLNERVNFAIKEVGDVTMPGIAAIVGRLSADRPSLSPEELIDGCLDLVGPFSLGPQTRNTLSRHAESGGELRFGTAAEKQESATRIGKMVQIIAATREYQFA